jgi:hypothetical protein
LKTFPCQTDSNRNEAGRHEGRGAKKYGEDAVPDAKNASLFAVRDYQEKALLADQLAGVALAVPLLGLFGETGSLLSEAKKKALRRCVL